MATQEVLNKIYELYSLLEQKIKDNDIRASKISEQSNGNVKFKAELDAKSSYLSARERILKKVENVAEGQKQVELDTSKNKRAEKVNEDMAAELIKKEKELDKAIEETKEAKARFQEKRDKAEAERTRLLDAEQTRLKVLKELKGIL